MRTLQAVAAAACVLAAAGVAAAPPAVREVPNALIVLEAEPGTPGSEPSAAPPRFVLLKDGTVFVGGTGRLDTGRLDKAEAQALRKGADAARKAAGRGGALSLGGDDRRVVRLRLPEDEPREVTITGEPAAAPPALRPVADFLLRVLAFEHPTLTRYAPASYALAAREGKLIGGCRSWGFAFPLADAVSAPRVVSAADAQGWPAGALPASVCVDDRHYVVTLRPLLPGEQP